MRNDPKYVIIHHTAYSAKSPQFALVNEWHRQRQFPISSLGFYVGYHYLIERDGTVRQARRHWDEGAHTKGKNLESLAIGLAGNFDFETPTKEQIASLEKLAAEVAQTLQNPALKFFSHWDFADTHCPGDFFRRKDWRFAEIKIKLRIIEKILLWILSKINK